jgi:hypothetical protein
LGWVIGSNYRGDQPDGAIDRLGQGSAGKSRLNYAVETVPRRDDDDREIVTQPPQVMMDHVLEEFSMCILRKYVILTIVPAVLLSWGPEAGAGPLSPSDFDLSGSGTFPTAPGSYTIDTSGTPTISGPGGTTITGSVSTDAAGHSIAVFDFNSIAIGAGETFTASGSLPLALLSRGDATIGGLIDGSGRGIFGGAGGPGGGAGASGVPQGGGPGGGSYVPNAGGGGGFGGKGGDGGVYHFAQGGQTNPSNTGGHAYGDLAQLLQGGSGGGGFTAAGGGGAIEIGALGSLTLSGIIRADGGSAAVTHVGGGGSGGGVFLYGDSVKLLAGALISARGGDGGTPIFNGGPGGGHGGGGGGGGGGRVLIEYGSGLSLGGTVDVQGGSGTGSFAGPGGAAGEGGVVEFAPIVPEPPSLVMGMIACVIGLGCAWRGRRSTAAA